MSRNGRTRVSFNEDDDDGDEEQPLLSRAFFSHEPEPAPLYSCVTNSANHLPVYTNIHRIRRDIISVVEDYLSLEQLRDVRINISVVRPLVDKLYELDDISIGMSLCLSLSLSAAASLEPLYSLGTSHTKFLHE
jgi:hypothetical protein